MAKFFPMNFQPLRRAGVEPGGDEDDPGTVE
jgi:hypothetical protein